jgi:indolepyruvate ferredoxin oxidoreductase beta subunit
MSTYSGKSNHSLDIFLIGVGGQGLLTIGEVVAEAATALNIPVSFYPYKGMAQRGGLVRAQLRLGRETVGPNIPPQGADLVIAMEVSEALRAIRALRPGGEFLLFGERWLPTAVMLGKAAYPTLEVVLEQIRAAGGTPIYLSPDLLPARMPANLFVLGAAVGHTCLGDIIPAGAVEEAIRHRWPRNPGPNLAAFQAGFLEKPQRYEDPRIFV